jgi:putative spermidine/putrescine transport system ATP-binding protein
MIYERPTSRFVADFIGNSNFLPATVTAKSDGHTRLETQDGILLESSIANDLGAGDRAAVAIRPESIRLTKGNGGTAVNSLSGTVLRSVFKGQSLSVWLGIGSGRELLVSLTADEAGEKAATIGERWTASWTAGRALVVREQ